MNCYFSKNYKGISSAGNKAKIDIERIMHEMGFKNIGLKQSTYSNKILSFVITLVSIIKTVLSVSKGDNVVIQYPLKKYFSFVCNLIHFRKGKVIVIIHDLGSFRRKRLTKEKEIKRLNHSDYIIAHNDEMRNWLYSNHCKAKIGTLEIFDYLSDATSQNKTINPNNFSVLYAGSLYEHKNKFLYEIGEYIESYNLLLYGNGFEIAKAVNHNHIKYMGFVKSDDLIKTSNGDFGLVWDGNSLDECSGDFGEYLKLNNPHKVSLYIRCNLPIIIWKDAALAKFVKDNNIGICISSLKEINNELRNISITDYSILKSNLKELNKKLSTGYFTKTSIEFAINHL